MRYFVFVNLNQEKELALLKEWHKHTEKTDDFEKLCIEFVDGTRGKELAKKSYINYILSCAKQIRYSFKNLKRAKENFPTDKNKGGDDFMTIEEAMALVFFMNAKAFLELIKKHTNFKIDSDLFKDITMIRNYFAHFYEKDFEQRKFFVRLSIERGLRELSVLEIRDIDTGYLIYELSFSLELFYFSLRDIFKTLKDDSCLFN